MAQGFEKTPQGRVRNWQLTNETILLWPFPVTRVLSCGCTKRSKRTHHFTQVCVQQRVYMYQFLNKEGKCQEICLFL